MSRSPPRAGSFTGRPEVYQPLLALLAGGPLSLATARQATPFATRPVGDLLQAFMLLVGGGFIHPMLPDPAAGRSTARAVNRAIARANVDGMDMPRLVAPAIGGVIPAEVLETLVVAQLLDDATADAAALAGQVVEVLRRGGRGLRWGGGAVDDPGESVRLVGELVGKTLGARLDLLRLLGVVGD